MKVMLARYTMYRGKRPDHDPLPQGIRQDTRKHTRHFLRPPANLVHDYLADPGPSNWQRFRKAYLETLDKRFRADRPLFDDLAGLASREDVYLGCSCPTRKNPDVNHCHTMLALEFMERHYPDLKVGWPPR